MLVFWYVNVVLPAAAELFDLPPVIGGGWLEGQAEVLSNQVELIICSLSPKVEYPVDACSGRIRYLVLPQKNAQAHLADALAQVQPDIVHIFGTEYTYNTDLIGYCSKQQLRFVVSLQGIMSQCAAHYADGLPERFYWINPILKWVDKVYYAESVSLEKQRFTEQGARETAALHLTNNVIGRTEWDRSFALEANPNIRYFSVNENLRTPFYDAPSWRHETCRKHSIFISQASYPIKGFHEFLKAMPALMERYPDLHIYVAGRKPYSLGNRLLDFGVDLFFEYQAYIKRLIKKLGVADAITFLGPQNAQEMQKQYLRCNVFVSTSTIENSPNSVGEAMILGVPVVASNVGGTSSLLTDEKEGILYPFGDTDALVKAICRQFDQPWDAAVMGQAAHAHAQRTHDRQANTAALMATYQTILVE